MKGDMEKTITPVLHERAVWTIDEAAAYLRVSRRKFDQLRKKPGFPGERMTEDGFPRYKAGEIMDWFDRQTVAA